MAEALDAGDIAIQKAIPIDINDNLGAVYNKLVVLAKEIIIEFLEKFDSLTLVSQDDSLATYAEKNHIWGSQSEFQLGCDKSSQQD